MQQPRVICPTLHAEQLHEERVWSATRAVLKRAGLRWTVFVEPLHARLAGIDLSPQLAWLVEHGHEVAMHTHHHLLQGEPGHTVGFLKGQHLEDQDVWRCLEEDHAYLVERGHVPKGFVSGSWLVLDSIFEWLAANGFVYDCTLRTYWSSGPHSSLVPDSVHRSVERVGALVELPTTANLRQQLHAELRPSRALTVDTGSTRYDMFCLHDYDFVHWRKRAAVNVLGRSRWRSNSSTVSELLDQVAV
jgi:peptidoglycan/xylan/chitin deacetylase (PgdA/CDA1 family)